MNAFARKDLTVGADALHGSGEFPDLRTRNVRYKDGAYRLAEGTERVVYVPTNALLGVGNPHDYACFLESAKQVYVRYEGGGGNGVALKYEPTDVFPARSLSEEDGGFCFLYGTIIGYYEVTCKSGMWQKRVRRGGLAGCQHGGRVFISTATDLYYTAVDGIFTDPSDKNPPDQSGRIALPDRELGTVKRMVSLGDRIVFVREYGISLLVAYGDPMNYRFLPPVHGPAGVVKYSVGASGSSVYYFSEWGLTEFDGSKITRIRDRAAREIDLGADYTGGFVSGDRYFANVTLKNGENWLYCYDFTEREGHFFFRDGKAAHLTGSPCFAYNRWAYRICERSAISNPDYPESWLDTGGMEPAGGRDFLLCGIDTDADGKFRLEVTTEHGTYSAEGAAKIRLPRPVRGKRYSLRFVTEEDGFVLRGFTLRGAEAV